MAAPAKNKKDETAVDGPAPAHSNELCTECGLVELDPASTTVFHCQHGTWTFTPQAPAPVPELSEADRRAAALAALGLTEEQIASLTPVKGS